MSNYQGRLMVGYVNKQYFYNQLRTALQAIEANPIEQDENAAYKLGVQFGQIDVLKKIIDLLQNMPQDDPNEVKKRRILGRPETFR